MSNSQPSELVEQIDLDRIEWKLLRDSNNQIDTKEQASLAVVKYRKFLNMKIMYPSVTLVPTDDIDTVWHTHILDTENYATDCELLFGKFLHHVPYFGVHSDETQEQMNEKFNQTSVLWELEYGGPLVSPVKMRCEGKACHVDTSCRCR